MNLPEFLPLLENALATSPGALQAETRLVDLAEFDSMGRVAIMAMADAEFGFVLEADQLDRCQTVADLFHLLVSAAGK